MSLGKLPSDYEDEIVLNWKHFFSFIILAFFIWSYIFFANFKEWVDTQINFIMSDWQLIFSLIGIIFLTVGWYLIELIALGIVYFHIRVSNKLSKKGFNIFRWSLAFFFLSLIISYRFFGYEFSDLLLWLVSFLIFCTLMGFAYIIHRMKAYIIRNRSKVGKRYTVFPIEPDGYLDIDMKYICLLTIIIIPTVFIFITNQWGITEYTFYLWDMIFSNVYLKYLFIIILLLTILWKPLLFLFMILANLSSRLIRESARRKINRLRVLLGIFIFILLLSKNLIFLPLTEVEIQIYSLILSLITTILSGYLLRRFT
jgi:hypothetical protein